MSDASASTPTTKETEWPVLKASRDLWNAFLKLPGLRDEDLSYARFHIHALQSIAAATFVSRTTQSFFADGRLTAGEQRDQAGRCSCRGSDDLCPCQNAPDAQTRHHRATGAAS